VPSGGSPPEKGVVVMECGVCTAPINEENDEYALGYTEHETYYLCLECM